MSYHRDGSKPYVVRYQFVDSDGETITEKLTVWALDAQDARLRFEAEESFCNILEVEG